MRRSSSGPEGEGGWRQSTAWRPPGTRGEARVNRHVAGGLDASLPEEFQHLHKNLRGLDRHVVRAPAHERQLERGHQDPHDDAHEGLGIVLALDELAGFQRRARGRSASVKKGEK
jgi:hypothetical protein